jgi:hypothetical protein
MASDDLAARISSLAEIARGGTTRGDAASVVPALRRKASLTCGLAILRTPHHIRKVPRAGNGTTNGTLVDVVAVEAML